MKYKVFTTGLSACLREGSKKFTLLAALAAFSFFGFSQPVADFTFAYTNGGCHPDSVLFTNTSTGYDSSFWDFGDFGPDTSSATNPYYIYTWYGTYTVVLTVYNTSTGDSAQVAKPVFINYTPDPWWAWFWTDPNPSCPGGDVQFNNFMFPAPDSVWWYFGDGDSSNITQPSHIYSDTGNYSITFIAYNSCGLDSEVAIHTVDSNVMNAAFFPDANPACPNQLVNFANNSFPAGDSAKWYFGDGDSAFTYNASHAYSAIGVYNVVMIVFGTCYSDTDTVSITIDNTIVPTVTAIASLDTVCPNDSVDFTGLGANLVSYSWDFDDGNFSLQQNTQHAFAISGTYNVVFTGTNSCGNSDTDTVTVVADPNARPTPSFSHNPWSFCSTFSNICPGTNVSFDNNTLLGVSYFWDFGDGNTSADFEPVHAYADTGAYNVKLVATSSCGGMDSVTNCVYVVDDADPTPWFCYNPLCFPSPVCVNSPVYFENFSADTTDVLWTFGNGDSSTAVNPVYTFTGTGSYTVTLKITNGCGRVGYYSETITVNTAAAPSVWWSWANPVSACPGDNIQFDGWSASAANYRWYFDDGDSATISNPIHVYTTAGTYNAMFVVFNDCGSDTDYVSITINPGPLADFTFDTVCVGSATIFTDQTSPVPDTWAWDFGDGDTSTTQNPSHTYAAGGTYNASLTVTKTGCVDNISYSVLVSDPTVSTTQTNVSCNAGSDGSATANPSGGAAPYSYTWDDTGLQTTQTATGLSVGTYKVTVTDVKGCADSATVVVTEPSALSVLTGSTPLTCNGGSDGTATASGLGGTPPYGYLWDASAGSQTTATATGLSAGTYGVTVTDANGCTVSTTETVTEPTALSLSTSKTDVSCNGGSDGTATVIPSGATPPYTYLWSDGQTDSTATGLIAASYDVTVTDANGCQGSATRNVSEPTLLVLAMSSTAALCNGNCDGSAAATPSGGTIPYTYLWDNAQTDPTAIGLCAGTYSVTVTDANSCTVVSSVTVTEPTALSVSISITEPTCFAACDALGTTTVSGGVAPYTYLWNDGTNNPFCPGACGSVTYTVTVTDANGCIAINSFTPTDPPLLTTGTADTDATCNGTCDGQSTVTPGGGTPGYTYLWSSGGTSATETGLCAGTYVVTVTDANGCVETDTATINEPTALSLASTTTSATCGGSNGTATVTPSGGTPGYTYLWDAAAGSQTDSTATGLAAGCYDVTVTDVNGCTAAKSVCVSNIAGPGLTTAKTDVSCDGGNDGTATVTAVGGTTPYSYLWDDGSAQTTSTATGLTAATYNVTVTDGNSCVSTGSVTVNEPSAITTSTSSTDASCNGICDGSASVSASGGTSPYSYAWSSGGTVTTETGLCAGMVYVTITDANGCTATDSASVLEPTALSSSTSSTDASCNGACDGNATVTASGGTTPYSYSWPSGGTNSTDSSLCAGNHMVTITDANGCILVDTATVSEPTAITISTSSSDATCGSSNGDATATASGGMPPYSYLWDNAQTTATATGLAAGVYSVTVTDSTGCSANTTASVNNAGGPTVNISAAADATCSGGSDGSATVIVTGGTSPFTYLWDDVGAQTTAIATGLMAGTYNVIVTDSNGCISTADTTISEPSAISLLLSSTDANCNSTCDGSASVTASGGTPGYNYLWSDGQTGSVAGGLCVGMYSVTATDANGCTAVDSVTISEPAALSISTSDTHVSCNSFCDGSATATASGGTAPYSYSWSSGGTASMELTLCAGSYAVTVTDANGCSVSDSVLIAEPTAISLTTSAVDANCDSANGNATVSALGGMPPYTYLWNDGGAQATASATGLAAGVYSVTVTDSTGCSVTATTSVNNIGGPTLNISAVSDVSCNGGSDGSATVTASGAATPFTYLWNDAGGQTAVTATGLAAGNYSVIVTDSNNCISSVDTTISEPSAISLVMASTDASCGGSCDGSASVTASGGTPGYSYLWSNGQTGSSATGLCAGTYSVTVTDNNGCTAIDSATISEPLAVSVSLSGTDASCNGACDGSASATASGGTPGYTYLWSDGQTGSSAIGLCSGSYSITTTDANGCAAVDSIIIGEPSTISILVTVNDANCGSSNGDATATASGGTPPYTYQWDDSLAQTTATATGLAAGVYNVTVTDSAGCTFTVVAAISNLGGPTISVSSTDETCVGNDGTATVTVTGGTSPFTYQWSDGQSTATATGLVAGNYNITVTDASSCISTASTTVGGGSGSMSVTTSTTDESCAGACDGSATATVSGGTSPYNYVWSTFDGLSPTCAGTYTVTVTDNGGCSVTASATIGSPSAIVLTTSSNPANCSVADGDATVTASGGTPPYSYLWNGGQTDSVAVALSSGSYSVTVTDANGCTATDSISVGNTSGLSASIGTITNVNCNGGSDGDATVVAVGGISPYTYSWGNGQTDATATGLS
ncbi:MAG: hypothetical protein COA57_12670, partial [Flavobacteriales bacterium]